MNWKDWKKMSIGSRVTVQCGNHKGRSGVITWLHPSRRLTEIKLDIGGDPVRLCYTSLQPFGYDMYDRKKDHYERARNAFNTAYQRMHETVYIVDRDP